MTVLDLERNDISDKGLEAFSAALASGAVSVALAGAVAFAGSICVGLIIRDTGLCFAALADGAVAVQPARRGLSG